MVQQLQAGTPNFGRVVQYTRTESGRLFGKDDPSSGSRVVVFPEVKKQEIVF